MAEELSCEVTNTIHFSQYCKIVDLANKVILSVLWTSSQSLLAAWSLTILMLQGLLPDRFFKRCLSCTNKWAAMLHKLIAEKEQSTSSPKMFCIAHITGCQYDQNMLKLSTNHSLHLPQHTYICTHINMGTTKYVIMFCQQKNPELVEEDFTEDI